MIWITIRNDDGMDISFYVSTRRLHKSQKEFYYFEKDKLILSLGSITDINLNKNLGKPIYIFTQNTLPFNLEPIQIKSNYWGFRDPRRPKLYRLAVIIWPPAYYLASSIIESILSYNRLFQVDNNMDVQVPSNQFLKFILNVYKGDRRCDRSQLPWKWSHMRSRKNRIVFFDLYVPKAKIGSNLVSKTAVNVKYHVRKKFKHLIPDYVHDIIIHIADNSAHSQNMCQYVQSYQT